MKQCDPNRRKAKKASYGAIGNFNIKKNEFNLKAVFYKHFLIFCLFFFQVTYIIVTFLIKVTSTTNPI